jgi:hypothetical protein
MSMIQPGFVPHHVGTWPAEERRAAHARSEKETWMSLLWRWSLASACVLAGACAEDVPAETTAYEEDEGEQLEVSALSAAPRAGSAQEDARRNPLASDDQLAAEELARELVATPGVRVARELLRAAWIGEALHVGGVSLEAWSQLDRSLDETVFSTALAITNNDPAYPKVVSILAAPHDWFGKRVPGSRTTFDNPDTTYRRIPVEASARYVIHGHRAAASPVDVNFSVLDLQNTTLANLTGDDLRPDAQGDYQISVDASAGDGSTPHLQLTAGASSVFVRNTIDQWGVQEFDSLWVERLGPPPHKRPSSKAELALTLALALPTRSGSFENFNRLAFAAPVNTLPPLSLGGTDGRLANQIASYSAFDLRDDEALVLHVTLGGAKYFIAPAYNRWQITTDVVTHTQTLNARQALPDADGSYTFVISPADPGVYNWIDTAGIHQGLLNLRWQGLPGGDAAPPTAELAHVKLRQLGAALPAGTRTVTPRERAAQVRARQQSYASRYASE